MSKWSGGPDIAKARYRGKKEEEQYLVEEASWANLDEAAKIPTPSAENQALQRIAQAALFDLVTTLPPREQAVLKNITDDAPLRSLQDELGVTTREGARLVKNKALRRARTHIRKTGLFGLLQEIFT